MQDDAFSGLAALAQACEERRQLVSLGGILRLEYETTQGKLIATVFVSPEALLRISEGNAHRVTSNIEAFVRNAPEKGSYTVNTDAAGTIHVAAAGSGKIRVT
jgi:hypothetical protein